MAQVQRPDLSSSSSGEFDVVVDANRSEQSVRTPFEHRDPGLRRQLVGTPTGAVVFQGGAHTVVGDRARVEADSASRVETLGKERTQLTGAAMDAVGDQGLGWTLAACYGAATLAALLALRRAG